MRIARNMCNLQGDLLLAAGFVITEQFLAVLHKDAVRAVRLETTEKNSSQCANARIDATLSHELQKSLRPGYKPKALYARLSPDDLRSEVQAGLEQHRHVAHLFAEVSASLVAGKRISGDRVCSAVCGLAKLLSLDGDLLTSIVGTQSDRGEDYLPDHAVNCAMISMTLASRLGLNTDQIAEFGVGALLADIGMLRVPDSIRMSDRSLGHSEFAEIQKHPVSTVTMLENFIGATATAKIAGSQAHERSDGSGYPRQRKASAIHPFARLLAVADSYAAMIEPRPFRNAAPPHVAIRELLKNGGVKRYDRQALLVFLDCVSVFPIGSYIAIKKGIVCRVVRANPGAHTRPIVVEIGKSGKPTDWVIDLSRERRLCVVAAGASLADVRHAQRSQT